MSADTEQAARVKARELEAANPLWIVIFGVYTGEFVCLPRFGVAHGSIVASRDPDALPPRLREAEQSALGAASPARTVGLPSPPITTREMENRPMKHDALFEFQLVSLQRLKLAADVILAEAEECGDVIPSSLESELVIFRERIERALLLPPDADWLTVA